MKKTMTEKTKTRSTKIYDSLLSKRLIIKDKKNIFKGMYGSFRAAFALLLLTLKLPYISIEVKNH